MTIDIEKLVCTLESYDESGPATRRLIVEELLRRRGVLATAAATVTIEIGVLLKGLKGGRLPTSRDVLEEWCIDLAAALQESRP